MPLDASINTSTEQFNASRDNCAENPPDRDAWQHISEPVGRLIEDMRGLVLGRRKYESKYTDDVLREMRLLWEANELSAREIGALLDVSKNVVIGHAHRRGWERSGVECAERRPRTTLERMDALHAQLDRLLAETLGVGRRPAE